MSVITKEEAQELEKSYPSSFVDLFRCPMTHQIFSDPIIGGKGKTIENLFTPRLRPLFYRNIIIIQLARYFIKHADFFREWFDDESPVAVQSKQGIEQSFYLQTRSLTEGQKIDVFDPIMNQWLQGTIVKVIRDKVEIKYDCWASKFNTILTKNSPWIQPYLSKTVDWRPLLQAGTPVEIKIKQKWFFGEVISALEDMLQVRIWTNNKPVDITISRYDRNICHAGGHNNVTSNMYPWTLMDKELMTNWFPEELVQLLTDSISGDFFQYPVVAMDNQTYEFSQIVKWLDGNHNTGPLTSLKINYELYSNFLLVDIMHYLFRSMLKKILSEEDRVEELFRLAKMVKEPHRRRCLDLVEAGYRERIKGIPSKQAKKMQNELQSTIARLSALLKRISKTRRRQQD